MSTRKLGIILTLPLLLLAMASSSYAQISNAAVLFLRIAPGARAAGMGEAYVAIADDATATHWNPAGLGAYPLTDSWTETDVPFNLRPLQAIAAVKRGGGSDYQAYEIWAISAKGLARYDNRDWYTFEKFNTRTDQTVRSIVSSYFKVNDDDLLSKMSDRVAAANAVWPLAKLESFRDSVLASVPEENKSRQYISDAFDTLMVAYPQVRIRWPQVLEAKQFLTDGLKDGALSDNQVERIRIALERARMRFIAEELTIPYAALVGDSVAAIAAQGNLLVVGTDNGLFSYNGRSWRTFTTADGLPSNQVLSISPSGSVYYVGTSEGVVIFTGRDIAEVNNADQLPDGPVTAIGVDGVTRLWIVLNAELYRYDGNEWSNGREYTIAVGDTPEILAERFTVYGTAQEKAAFIEKLKALNVGGPITKIDSVVAPSGDIPRMSDVSAMVQAANDTTAADSTETAMDESAPDTTAVADAMTAMADTSAAMTPSIDWTNLNPGDIIRIPYAVGFKGKIKAMFAKLDDLYIGTTYGLLTYMNDKWALRGYGNAVVADSETVDDFVAKRRFLKQESAATYRAALMAINNLPQDGSLTAGETLRVAVNDAAAPINLIRQRGGIIYLATAEGLRAIEGNRLVRVTEKGMDRANAIYIESVEDELWLASDRRIVTKANGHMEFSLMHVNWLPELASDMYYEFLSGVFQVGDYGTAGFNITYLTYGSITRTGSTPEALGTFEPFDIAMTGSFGTSLRKNLKFGLSLKVIYSRLSDQGAGSEKGKGTSTGFAADFGFLYQASKRLNVGLAVTNIGPKMTYIDAAQADPLPTNLALGLAYKLIQTDYAQLMVTMETNKLLVDMGGGFSQEIKELILNGGAEFMWNDLIAARVGYIYDQVGEVKTPTLGAGLHPMDWLKVDFSYIPNSQSVALANTLRMSLSIIP